MAESVHKKNLVRLVLNNSLRQQADKASAESYWKTTDRLVNSHFYVVY